MTDSGKRTLTTEPCARAILPPASRSAALVPAERYRSADFARRELDAVFLRCWNLVCREEELPDPGDYVEFSLGGQSVVLIKTTDEQIKAFHNVCLHRGAQLCHGTGSMSELRCGYHSWCWNLDGSLKEVVDPYEFHPELISPEALQLPEVQVDCWGGFCFVNFDRDAPGLFDHLGPLVPALASYRLEDMRYQQHWRVRIPANWKTVMDNFGETYHFPTLHPQSMMLANEVDVVVETVGDHTIMKVPVAQPSRRLPGGVSGRAQLEMMLEVPELIDATERQLLEDLLARAGSDLTPEMIRQEIIGHRRTHAETLKLSDLAEDQLVEDWDVRIFPNIELNILFDQVFGYIAYPDEYDPGMCTLDIINLVQPAVGDEAPWVETETVEDYRTYPWNPVIAQDMAMFARVERGIRSRAFRGMRFASYRELGLINSHQALDRWLAEFESAS